MQISFFKWHWDILSVWKISFCMQKLSEKGHLLFLIIFVCPNFLLLIIAFKFIGQRIFVREIILTLKEWNRVKISNDISEASQKDCVFLEINFLNIFKPLKQFSFSSDLTSYFSLKKNAKNAYKKTNSKHQRPISS